MAMVSPPIFLFENVDDPSTTSTGLPLLLSHPLMDASMTSSIPSQSLFYSRPSRSHCSTPTPDGVPITNRKRTSSANATASTPPMVAIDSKIEQAMDLVKTHLMFAVREEVEVLRARIVDLEGHVHHLEAENNVLRSHVPDDILKKMNLH